MKCMRYDKNNIRNNGRKNIQKIQTTCYYQLQTAHKQLLNKVNTMHVTFRGCVAMNLRDQKFTENSGKKSDSGESTKQQSIEKCWKS